jgi:antitoxin (DNA-binding transcriptional repressor) of toxin-antitoxin stability system
MSAIKPRKTATKDRPGTRSRAGVDGASTLPRTISASQAARTFADLLTRVRNHGETFVIEEEGEPLCEISPMKPPPCTGADLLALWRSLPKPDRGFWVAVEEATKQQPMVPASPWEH